MYIYIPNSNYPDLYNLKQNSLCVTPRLLIQRQGSIEKST